MGSPNQQSLLSRLIEATPPGQNPFINGIQALGQGSFPDVPAYSYHILIFFMVVYGAIALGAGFLILFPLLKGPEMRKKHLWLWNKCYIGSTDTTPFYIPNNSLSVAVCQFLTSILFLVYLVLHYISFHSIEFARTCHIVIWLDLALLPGFIGFWITGVNSLYTCLCSPHRNFEEPRKSMRWLKFFTSPSVLNVFCILVPLLVTLKTIYWTIAQSVASERLWSQHDTVIILFDRAAKQWSPNIPINGTSERMLELQQVVDQHITLVHRLAVNVRIAGIQWNVSIFVLSLFYCLTTGALIHLVRRSLKIASGKLNILTGQKKFKQSDRARPTPEAGTQSSISTVVMADQGSKAATNLQRGYMHLTVQCLFLSLCLLFDLSTSFFFTTHAHLITKNGDVRASTVWVSRIGSIFMAVSTLLRSWRIYNTKEVQQESQTYTVICVSPEESEKTSVKFKSPLRDHGETVTSLESEDQHCNTRLDVSHVSRHHWSQDDGNKRSDPERSIYVPPHPPT